MNSQESPNNYDDLCTFLKLPINYDITTFFVSNEYH